MHMLIVLACLSLSEAPEEQKLHPGIRFNTTQEQIENLRCKQFRSAHRILPNEPQENLLKTIQPAIVLDTPPYRHYWYTTGWDCVHVIAIDGSLKRANFGSCCFGYLLFDVMTKEEKRSMPPVTFEGCLPWSEFKKRIRQNKE